MRKPKHRVKKSSVPKVTEAIWESHRDQTQCCGSLCPSVHYVLPADAAFLAREKARADAECYTAMKIAEANKVKARCTRCREGTFGFRLIVWEFPVLGALHHPKAHVARSSEPCAACSRSFLFHGSTRMEMSCCVKRENESSGSSSLEDLGCLCVRNEVTLLLM